MACTCRKSHIFMALSSAKRAGPCLVLSGADRENGNRDAVELIEAAPGACLSEPLVDLAHGLVVHLIAAVEHVALHSQRPRQILCRLCLARA